jgi:pilus assembly protein Flp/PilA
MNVVAMQMLYLRATEGLRALRDREEGQGMVEYGLILALVSVAAIVALGIIGTNVNGVFEAVGTKLGEVPLP